MIPLLGSSWFCILGGDTVAWLPAEHGQWVQGCPAPTRTQGNVGNGIFDPGSGLSCGSGSFSSRGALIGFAVAPIAPSTCDAGWRPGGISSFGDVWPWHPVPPRGWVRGPLARWGCCRSLGRWQPFPAAGGRWVVGLVVGRGVASATLGKGQMEGRRHSVLGRGACSGGVLLPPSSRLSSQCRQGLGGTFSVPVC